VLHRTPRPADVWTSGGIALILTSALDKDEWVNFTPEPLYYGGKSPRYTWDRRLGASESRFGRIGE